MSAPRPIPEALLERYLAGDLSPDERRALDERLQASPEDRARLTELEAESAAYLVKHPPGPVVAKLEGPKRGPARWWAYVFAPVAAAAIALAVFVTSRPDVEPESELKGSLVLVVHRQTEGGTEKVSSGATLRAGDKLRFEVRAPGDGYVAVLSRDGNGTVTVYFPFRGTRAAAYRAGAPLLEGAIALDETPGTEDLWALYSPEPFELDAQVKRLQRGEEPSGVAAHLSWNKR